MKGRTIVITGASSGLGLETARQLARQGAELVLVCRDPARGATAQRDVAQAGMGRWPTLRLADLSSMKSVRALAADLRAGHPGIDVLINNAGGVFARRELTEEGIEKTLATNYLAPFLLTQLLCDPLNASPAPRVINVVSALHGVSPDVLRNLQGDVKYNFMLAYKISKFALISFMYEFNRRYFDTRIRMNCIEPGPTKTRFGDGLTGVSRLFPLIMKRLPLFRAASDRARAIVHLAASPQVEGLAGAYFVGFKAASPKAVTRDEDLAMRLWAASARLTGLDQHPVPSSALTRA